MTQDAQHLSRRERAELRRAEIVSVAAELFSRTGYRGTALADVAAKAGITQPGLLHHFGSKEGLLLAVIERRDASSEKFARDLVGKRDSREVLAGMGAFARRNKEQPGLAKLFAVLVAESLEPDSPGHEHFVGRYRSIRGLIAEMIKAGQEIGDTRADVDPYLKATEIVATLDGLQIQWLMDPDEVDIVTSIEAYADTIARDLAAR